MEDQKITTKEYYKELHSAARNYNTKLWTIPGLYILVVGFIFQNLHLFDPLYKFASIQNLILLMGGGLIIFILLVQSHKDSFFQISIQKKINELEKEIDGMSLYSANDIQITRRLQELKEAKDPDLHADFSHLREFLIRRTVSRYFFIAAHSSLVSMGVAGIYIVLKLLHIIL